MDREPRAALGAVDPRFDAVWRNDRGYLLALATRMLGDPAEAEDAVQDAFSRLARVDLEELDDVRGWLTVVVRRLCLDRIRSAYSRRETATGGAVPDGYSSLPGVPAEDPADRVTLDDQVQRALAVVLDRLTPAERTSFVLHDVFGFTFAAVAEVVGRTPAACRQLASRARRSIRSDAPPVAPNPQIAQHRILAERFIAACAGGDIVELMEVLDPEVVGEATLIGHGPLVALSGRPVVAQRILGLFGPGTGTLMVPLEVEESPGLVGYAHGRLAVVVRLDERDGRIRHISSMVLPPT